MADLPEGLEVLEVPADWGRFPEVDDLRFRALHEPFGVPRQDEWNDRDPRARHVVALLHGELAGYGRLDKDGSTGVVKQLSVYPEYQRRGVGREVMRRLIEVARSEGLSLVTLDARTAAEGFYRKLGFSPVGPVFHAPRTYLPHVRMVMDLGAGNATGYRA